MKSNSLISVIMPVYNGEKFINEAIQSILEQSYTNFELIIVNDGSTDNTEKIILGKNDNRIRYYKNKTNLKLIKTLNYAITLCSGDYIARMDADDICEQRRLEEQLKYMKKHPDCGICGTWARVINEDGKKIGRIKNPIQNEVVRVSLLFTPSILHPSVMFRSNVIKEFQYSEEALHVEDFDLWVRIAYSPKIEFHNLPKFLLKYRWHDSNISVLNDEFQYEKKKNIIRESLRELVNKEKVDLDLHLATFNLYRFNQKMVVEHSEEKILKWLEDLCYWNRIRKSYSYFVFDSFMLSRWFVYNIHSRKFNKIFHNSLIGHNYLKIFKAISILFSK